MRYPSPSVSGSLTSDKTELPDEHCLFMLRIHSHMIHHISIVIYIKLFTQTAFMSTRWRMIGIILRIPLRKLIKSKQYKQHKELLTRFSKYCLRPRVALVLLKNKKNTRIQGLSQKLSPELSRPHLFSLCFLIHY